MNLTKPLIPTPLPDILVRKIINRCCVLKKFTCVLCSRKIPYRNGGYVVGGARECSDCYVKTVFKMRGAG